MNRLPSEHAPIETDIPARLDSLPWGAFHWLLVTALGITWVLDGLGVTVVMLAAALVEWFAGVDAERKALEDVASPLSAEESVPEPALAHGRA